MEILSTGHLNRDELGTLYAIARDLSGANLSGANLEGANLRFADLSKTDLTKANLRDADLNFTNLEGANLKGVFGITVEELKKQADSLKGATMPDGSIHD